MNACRVLRKPSDLAVIQWQTPRGLSRLLWHIWWESLGHNENMCNFGAKRPYMVCFICEKAGNMADRGGLIALKSHIEQNRLNCIITHKHWQSQWHKHKHWQSQWHKHWHWQSQWHTNWDLSKDELGAAKGTVPFLPTQKSGQSLVVHGVRGQRGTRAFNDIFII
jgi:hypothetical protein